MTLTGGIPLSVTAAPESSRTLLLQDSPAFCVEIRSFERYSDLMKFYRLLILVLAGVGLTVPLRRWVIEPIYVASASMEPTLRVGARLFSDKLTLRLRPPLRGDIVLFPSPTGEALSMGKRVISVPGETVEIRAKKVFINGVELLEPYAVHSRGQIRLEGDDLGPLQVPEGTVFVLGDNRDVSDDATVWKSKDGRPIYFLPASTITGIVRSYSAVAGATAATINTSTTR